MDLLSRLAAHRLIVLHPKQKIESELKWQTRFGTVPSKFICSSVKELKMLIVISVRLIIFYDFYSSGFFKHAHIYFCNLASCFSRKISIIFELFSYLRFTSI